MSTAQIVEKMFNALDRKGLTEYKLPQNFTKETKKIQAKVIETHRTFIALQLLYTTPRRWSSYVLICNGFNLTEEDLQRVYTQYMIQYALDYIEMMKRVIVENLKKGRRINRKKISFNMPLGTLVESLAKDLRCPDILTLIPYAFRNVLGHGAWWWENRKFVYVENGREKKLTYSDFITQMDVFADSYLKIFETTFRRI